MKALPPSNHVRVLQEDRVCTIYWDLHQIHNDRPTSSKTDLIGVSNSVGSVTIVG